LIFKIVETYHIDNGGNISKIEIESLCKYKRANIRVSCKDLNKYHTTKNTLMKEILKEMEIWLTNK